MPLHHLPFMYPLSKMSRIIGAKCTAGVEPAELGMPEPKASKRSLDVVISSTVIHVYFYTQRDQ